MTYYHSTPVMMFIRLLKSLPLKQQKLKLSFVPAASVFCIENFVLVNPKPLDYKFPVLK